LDTPILATLQRNGGSINDGRPMGLTALLLLIGVATAVVAFHGLVRGSVYCKGGPYSRTTQPLAFWSSVTVYLMWTGLMVYFAVFRAT
jgi:hypothetical protein